MYGYFSLVILSAVSDEEGIAPDLEEAKPYPDPTWHAMLGLAS